MNDFDTLHGNFEMIFDTLHVMLSFFDMDISLKQKIWMERAKMDFQDNKDEDMEIKEMAKADDSAGGICCQKCQTKMADEEHKPMTIAPCGHTICKKCLDSLKENRFCPFCRQKIIASAVNFSLKKIADEVCEDENAIPDFQKQFDDISIEIGKIFERLDANKDNQKALQEKIHVNTIVLDKLQKDFEEVKLKQKILKEKFDESQENLKKAEQEENDLKQIVDELRDQAKMESLQQFINSSNV